MEKKMCETKLEQLKRHLSEAEENLQSWLMSLPQDSCRIRGFEKEIETWKHAIKKEQRRVSSEGEGR